MHRILHSKIFSGILLVLLALSLAALFREISRTIKVKREIARLEQQAIELQSKNQDLKQVIEYLGSASYMDKAARENLNLQAAGEIAVALPSQSPAEESVNQLAVTRQDNFSKWWNYFFGLRMN